MNDKNHMLMRLREEYNRWETLLDGMDEAQITARQLPDGLSIKDVVAHLHAWQQISIARLEAALDNREPDYPAWVVELQADADREEDNDRTNAWIHEHYHDQAWARVQQDWRTGFGTLLEAGAKIPEHDLIDTQKYPWLGGYALMAVLEGTYEHHHEDHFEPLQAWLRAHGHTPSAG